MTISVADGINGVVSRPFTLTVQNVNRPPEIKLPEPLQPSYPEGAPMSFTVVKSDPDGDEVAWLEPIGLPEGATFVDGVFSWTPDFDQGGVHRVTFRAEDACDTGDIGELSVAIAVGEQLPPVIADPGSREVREGEMLSVPMSASDHNGDPWHWLPPQGLPEGAHWDGDTGTLTWTPGFDQAGVHPVTFRAEDEPAEEGVASQVGERTVLVTVIHVNRAPVIEITDGAPEFTEGEYNEFIVQGTDPDGDTVTLEVRNLPEGVTVRYIPGNPATATIAWTPGFDAAGSYPINILATDDGVPQPETNDRDFTLIVRGSNRPPELTVPREIAGPEGALVTFTATASDPDGDNVTFTLKEEGRPDGASIDPDTGVFTWYPPMGAAEDSPYLVTIVATDDHPDDPKETHVGVPITVYMACTVARLLSPTGDMVFAESESSPFPVELMVERVFDESCAPGTIELEYVIDGAPASPPLVTTDAENHYRMVVDLVAGVHTLDVYPVLVETQEQLTPISVEFEIRQLVDQNADGYPDDVGDINTGDTWDTVVEDEEGVMGVRVLALEGDCNAAAEDDETVLVLTHPDDPAQAVEVRVPNNLLNCGEEGLLIVAMADDLSGLLGADGAQGMAPLGSERVAGGVFVEVSLITSTDGWESFSEINDARLVAHPISVTLGSLSLFVENCYTFKKHPSAVISDGGGGFILIAEDGEWSDTDILMIAQGPGSMTAELTSLSIITAVPYNCKGDTGCNGVPHHGGNPGSGDILAGLFLAAMLFAACIRKRHSVGKDPQRCK